MVHGLYCVLAAKPQNIAHWNEEALSCESIMKIDSELLINSQHNWNATLQRANGSSLPFRWLWSAFFFFGAWSANEIKNLFQRIQNVSFKRLSIALTLHHTDWFCTERNEEKKTKKPALCIAYKLMCSRRKWQIKIDVVIEGIIILFRWAMLVTAHAQTMTAWQYLHVGVSINRNSRAHFEWRISQVWSGFRSNV